MTWTQSRKTVGLTRASSSSWISHGKLGHRAERHSDSPGLPPAPGSPTESKRATDAVHAAQAVK